MPHKPDVPCTICGKLTWSGRGSAPADRRVCLPCRRRRNTEAAATKRKRGPNRLPGEPRRRTKYDHACIACGEAYQSERRSGRFCSLTCRDLWKIDHPADPTFSPLPKNHPARWTGRASAVVYGNCFECGALFCSPERAGKRFCSTRCKRRVYERQRSRGRKQARRVRKRMPIFERDGFVCWLCGDACDRTVNAPHPLAPTIDHVTPRAHGGGDEPENLACAHFICNVTRQDNTERLTYPSPVAA